ncbi:MAG TPA: outer membrane lipoprotein-sorting protein [Steroidobacteraceae bacterium]
MTATIRLVMSAVLLFAGVAVHAQTATEIVAATDRVRNPHTAFRSTIRFTEYSQGRERDHDTLLVFSKEDPATHQFRNLVQYSEPARDAGKRVLLDGGSLWFYDPFSKTSIRISPQQRLIGQAAVGDVLTVNLVVDYNATLLGTEKIVDAARMDRQCWHLELRAANDRAVYNRIEYWVEQGTFNPIKGKLYSDSGKLLKIVYFRNFAQRLGAVRPIEEIIIDAVDTSLATTATFNDDAFQDVPDIWFQRDYLPRLQIK